MVHSSDGNSATALSLCTKLLMNTVKRDISAVEASFELATLPLYRCTELFQSVSLSGSRVLERTGATTTKKTPLDRYLDRHEKDQSSWYQFICNSGKVPVIAGATQATWPLTPDYCRTMLLLHSPNWRSIKDIAGENPDWIEAMNLFVQTDKCPNFVLADIQRARNHATNRSDDAQNSDSEEEQGDADVEQPEWMELIQPNTVYDDYQSEFDYFDGGPEYNWTASQPYSQDNALTWLERMTENARAHVTDDLKHPMSHCQL
jgi:hypothetical protein